MIDNVYEKVLSRQIVMIHHTQGFKRDVQCDLTQHDIMKIMKYLKSHNTELYNKLNRFIKLIDEETDVYTDFKRKLPKRILFR